MLFHRFAVFDVVDEFVAVVLHETANGENGSIGNNMAGRTICALADAAVFPVRGFMKHYRDEFVHYIEHGKPMKEHKWC